MALFQSSQRILDHMSSVAFSRSHVYKICPLQERKEDIKDFLDLLFVERTKKIKYIKPIQKVIFLTPFSSISYSPIIFVLFGNSRGVA